MKEFIGKLISRLEESSYDDVVDDMNPFDTPNKVVLLSEAIEIINELAEECINTSTDTSRECNKALDSLHKKILHSKLAEEVTESELEALVEAKYNGWIPCSERLPEVEDVYLITILFHRLQNPVVMACNFEDGEWWEIHKNDKVIAWCELPAPYKEGRIEYE